VYAAVIQDVIFGHSFSQSDICLTLSPRISGCFVKKCQNVSCRAENRAALWLPRTPSKPLHFSVLVVQKPVLLRNRALSSTQRSVGNSAGTGWSSQCWESWKRLK